MEARLHNIFKSKNITKMTNRVIESSDKVLLGKNIICYHKTTRALFYGLLNFEQLLTFKLI